MPTDRFRLLYQFFLATVLLHVSNAQTFVVLHSFDGTDGATPWAGVIRDGKGNLYGTTVTGGSAQSGTLFKLTPGGALKVLYTFSGGLDGQYPYAPLIRDGDGNLYGTTQDGGNSGSGTIFIYSPTTAKSTLYSFSGSDGAHPWSGLVRDKDGNLLGTTVNGGKFDAGTVFKLNTANNLTVLYSFTDGKDGGFPYAGLVRDKKGNLYGTTVVGQNSSGTVFKLTLKQEFKVLHRFTQPLDGATPYAGLLRDSDGNLYGSTFKGGAHGAGCVFRINSSRLENILYDFNGGVDGNGPYLGALVRDSSGNLYGTTKQGGTMNLGTVFRLDPTGKETVLHSFTGAADDGAYPFGALLRDKHGNLYGTTVQGGAFGVGTVYKITP
jgi:uncharacterized repeat protein (TIGR03803 family)